MESLIFRITALEKKFMILDENHHCLELKSSVKKWISDNENRQYVSVIDFGNYFAVQMVVFPEHVLLMVFWEFNDQVEVKPVFFHPEKTTLFTSKFTYYQYDQVTNKILEDITSRFDKIRNNDFSHETIQELSSELLDHVVEYYARGAIVHGRFLKKEDPADTST